MTFKNILYSRRKKKVFEEKDWNAYYPQKKKKEGKKKIKEKAFH